MKHCETIYGRNKLLETSSLIPTDLIIEIFSRLPSKSIAICHCLSKFWNSILGLPYFTELFLTKSSTRPQLLFALEYNCEWFLYSTHQPQNHVDESFSRDHHHVAKYLMQLPCGTGGVCQIHGTIRGLVYLTHNKIVNGRLEKNGIICNPTTRQVFTLPKVNSKRTSTRFVFGYDPIDKHFKILSMAFNGVGRNVDHVDLVFEEHQILTLDTNETMSWRMIECCLPPHYSPYYVGSRCINGILYYPAIDRSSETFKIVCFDVRFEKFRFIEISIPKWKANGTLVNYNGKLGALMYDKSSSFVDGSTRSFEMWVLEDSEKQEWSKHIYVLPPLWKNVVGEFMLYFVGIIGTNQILLSPVFHDGTFQVFYYNFEKKTILKVGIKGLKMSKSSLTPCTFLDHVENLKLI